MSEKALAAAIWPNLYGSSTMGVKKSAVCRSRPPLNGTYPASSLVSIPLTKPSTAVGASPLRACSRSPGANFDAQPALVEYFVSLMRARSSIADKSIPARTEWRHKGRSPPRLLGAASSLPRRPKNRRLPPGWKVWRRAAPKRARGAFPRWGIFLHVRERTAHEIAESGTLLRETDAYV